MIPVTLGTSLEYAGRPTVFMYYYMRKGHEKSEQRICKKAEASG